MTLVRTVLLLPALLCGAVFARADLTPSAQFLEQHDGTLDKLFASLDLTQPALAEAAEAEAAGDRPAACAALLRYYQRKSAPSWVARTLVEAHTHAIASSATRDRFSLQGITYQQPRLRDGSLDWDHRGPRNDKEWAWLLNRMRHLRDLALAYRDTRDPLYAATASSHIRDWTEAHPYPGRLSFSTSWRALEAARRILDAWPHAFYLLQQAPEFSPEARLLLLASVADHAHALRHFPTFWGGNHLLTEKTALLALASAWPEFRDAPRWRSIALDAISQEIFSQTYPDGAFAELTNHYQRVVLVSLLQVLAICGQDASPQVASLRGRTEAMFDYFAGLMRPDGSGPLNSASDAEYNAHFLRQALTHFNRPDWLYRLSRGEEGTPPRGPPSQLFAWAGHVVFRDSWDQPRHWAFFDAGPHGTAHQHADALNFTLFAGKPLLVDNGRYDYRPGPWRDYFSGPRAHNVVLLDGQGLAPPPNAARRPASVHTAFSHLYDFAAASGQFPRTSLLGGAPATHTRAILYLRGQGWIVLDHIRAFGPHQLETRWHFAPEVNVTTHGTALTTANPGQPHLQLVPLGEVDWQLRLRRGELDPIDGWHAPQYNERHPSTVALYQAEIRQPTLFAWLLWPQDANHPQPLPEPHWTDLGGGLIQLALEEPSGAGWSLSLSLRDPQEKPRLELLRHDPSGPFITGDSPPAAK